MPTLSKTLRQLLNMKLQYHYIFNHRHSCITRTKIYKQSLKLSSLFLQVTLDSRLFSRAVGGDGIKKPGIYPASSGDTISCLSRRRL